MKLKRMFLLTSIFFLITILYFNQHINLELSSHKIVVNFSSCTNTFDISDGKWIFRNNLKTEDLNERTRLDEEIRLSMNWPKLLFRNDSRCGAQFPLYNYQLLAQCNPNSNKPCCNQVSGVCGQGDEYCNCDNCTDFRSAISAELGVWKPNACYFNYQSYNDTCSLFLKKEISMLFVGDSLIRQIYTVMLMILTNNYFNGSIPSYASEKDKFMCTGEHQVTNKDCSVRVVAQNSAELPFHALCNGANVTIKMIQDYNHKLAPEVYIAINKTISQENNWIIAGVGLHYQLKFENLKSVYLDPLWELLSSSLNAWPKLIWFDIHGIFGFLRMRTAAMNDEIVTFNKKIQQYWEHRNVTVVKTFNFSQNLRSYDGRHYGVGFNELKAQLILHLLKDQL
ncbi:uncharacterized protein LOC105844769 [Hydra vulgaris]|uniref:uncharacterized protein LOC105844769 n=1 Tax=Hydra vulgaris TaxID=6087 RepID=UPI001F5EF941|nr:uncharacterized protein LOC105844769 [Hydra vulgaris]